MDEIAFSDWPGQPVDLNSGNNPWLPAYGFQTPSTLLDKDDFIGNPDAEYFLHENDGQYMYLETILEETSDDLCSEESDHESRGWLATDSEAGSVICIDAPDDAECESDREIACPAKRRKHDFFLNLPNADEDLSSLSRSSSLLQFESLEKQCQEVCTSSPSIYSQYSFDALNSPSIEDETDYYKTLKIDVPVKKQAKEDLSYAFVYSGSESSDSDATLDTSRSLDCLKTWKSYDNLPNNTRGVREKASVENLSEDSGYSDHLTKSSSTNNLKEKLVLDLKTMKHYPEKRYSYVGFTAYDGEFPQENFSGNFGVSYQDLTSFKANQLDSLKTSPLIDHLNSRKQRSHFINDISDVATKILKLDAHQECDRKSNYKSSFPSSSEPNLLQTSSKTNCGSIGSSVCVSSVPKDLNYIGATAETVDSVAAKDWNLADLCFDFSRENNETVVAGKADSENMSHYKREGSYSEAMSNRVDLSDDEHSLYNKRKPKLPKTPIVEFDKRVLKAISEQSLQSILSSSQNILQKEEVYTSTPISTKQRSVASTPNLAIVDMEQKKKKYFEEERRKSVHDVRRKGSIIKSSTSTSGMSDSEDKTLVSVKSFSGSSNSKGVHFSPVVSEVNWRDDSVSTVTPDRESSYSLGSSSPERRRSPSREIVKPQPRFAAPSRLSYSQPDLSDNDSCRREFVDSLKNLRDDNMSKSQPDVNRFRRRGSQLIKKDKDGSVIKAYVDGDGIQYKHTHLDIGIGFGPHQHNNNNNASSEAETGGNKNRVAKPVDDMEAQDTFRRADHAQNGRKQSKASGKIGGFFSRLANFRFSLKRGVEEKGKPKKKGAGSNAALPNQQQQQRIASKDDYIYIPLKGPLVTDNNNLVSKSSSAAAAVTAKPPLPKQPPPRVVHASVKAPTSASSQRRRTIDGAQSVSVPMEEPMGLIETDLDTEVTVITGGGDARTRSLLDLGGGRPACRLTTLAPGEKSGREDRHRDGRPHKSMEFLLDKQNLRVVEPPENELQKGERVMSEHQLRVQRSLQKLTIPDWYKQSQVPREGFLLKKQQPRDSSKWTGTGSKTTSLSSLGSAGNNSSLALSPTPSTQPFVRWSTSKLNSTASSPCASTRSSFNARQPNGSISPSSVRSSFSYRQPYMGWRSQERLSRPRTPAERLASSLLSSQNQQPQESPEIQTSIKEVTSAIVHYVSGLRPEDTRDKSYESQETASQRSNSVSPRGSQKLCWLESSFVGTRPPDSPETPVAMEDSQRHTAPVAPANLRLDLQNHDVTTTLATCGITVKPSPSSTTLEDVLDSLLGLPTTGRAPSPSLQETVSANTSPCRQGQLEDPTEQFRRRSEGSEPVAVPLNDPTRRSSFNCLPVVRCRYSRCGKTTVATSPTASSFKNCHNCSYTYCSRSCRRAHWEKHRKTCLFSRIGTLCRQVIAAAKEKKDTLVHLSQMSRRGYLSHGHGAVKCFFPNPEAAEKFLTDGLSGLGELTFVRWQDLLPSEMGPQMYAELMKMCKNYNADAKFVLYVSVCVISETPATGSIKWERQLVSRCAKMKLSKEVQIPEREASENPETLILTSAPIDTDCFRIKELRQISVDHLQSHLRFRGVSLKYQYPGIFKQLDTYCSDPNVKFTPLTVYPKDALTGKSLMCIIMLEANEESLKEVENAGVKVRTVDLMKDVCID